MVNLNLPLLPNPTRSSKNVELIGLSKAIDVLTQDMASEVGKKPNTLKGQQLARRSQNNHEATLFNISAPMPKIQCIGDTQWINRFSCHKMMTQSGYSPFDNVLDYDPELSWPDEDNDTSSANSKLLAATEDTDELLQDSFTKAVPSATRKQRRECHGNPKCLKTCIPKFNMMVKDTFHQEAA